MWQQWAACTPSPRPTASDTTTASCPRYKTAWILCFNSTDLLQNLFAACCYNQYAGTVRTLLSLAFCYCQHVITTRLVLLSVCDHHQHIVTMTLALPSGCWYCQHVITVSILLPSAHWHHQHVVTISLASLSVCCDCQHIVTIITCFSALCCHHHQEARMHSSVMTQTCVSDRTALCFRLCLQPQAAGCTALWCS